MEEVVFVTRLITHYRVRFHELVRSELQARGLRYRLLYSRPTASEAAKGDLAPPEWAEEVPIIYLTRGGLCWQDLAPTRGAALVILNQESKLLANYLTQLARLFGGPRLAFFGHGRNFQADRADSAAERFKRFWVNKVDWWFAYTGRSAQIVAGAGFPRDRITIFNNAIDTSAIRGHLDSISPAELASTRAQFGGSENIGVYVGGLYGHKRLPFLIDAAKAVRKQVPDFQLLIIGSGVDLPLVERAAAENDWIHALGPKFGREKTLLVSLAKVFLMPGLVGLGVLDSFAYGTPMVTTDIPYHSPEIDYLQDGTNGIVVADAENVGAFAEEVIRVVRDVGYRRQLQTGAREALHLLTVEAMAQRFVEGVIHAIAAPAE